MRTSLLEFISKRMKGLFIKVQSVDKKRLLKCSIAALILLVAGYFCNNLSVFTKEDSRSLFRMEHVWNNWVPNNLGIRISEDTIECKDVIFLNTSYDRELIPQIDKEDEYLGTTDVLNRETLYKFLEILKEENVNYKYLIIDVDFSKELANHRLVFDSVSGDSVEIDKLLFDLIGSMDRVVVALPKGENLEAKLKRKAAPAKYNATAVVSRFVRYKYFDTVPYIPLKVYNSLQKQKGLDTITHHFLLGDEASEWCEEIPPLCEVLNSLSVCTQGGSLCYNSLFIPFPIGNISENNRVETAIADEVKENYVNLGWFFADSIINESKERLLGTINAMCEDKYVFIGDMVKTDMHTTYAGKKAGSYVMYKALKELESGKHKVSLGMMLLLFVIYVWMVYRMASKKNIIPIPKRLSKTDNPLVILLVDVCTFSMVFSSIHFFEYMGERRLYSFALSMLFFTFLKFYMLMRTRSKKKLLSILLAVLAVICLSFTSSSPERYHFQVLSKNPKGVLINGVVPTNGMCFKRGAIIKFTDSNAILRVQNIGSTIVNQRGEIWEKYEFKDLGVKNNKKIFNTWWWFFEIETNSKGGESFAGHHYLAGGFITFPVNVQGANDGEKNPIYYKLTCIKGKCKGASIWLNNDSTDPVVWLFADSLKKEMELKENRSYRFKVEKYNAYDDEYSLITDSCIIEYIK